MFISEFIACIPLPEAYENFNSVHIYIDIIFNDLQCDMFSDLPYKKRLSNINLQDNYNQFKVIKLYEINQYQIQMYL